MPSFDPGIIEKFEPCPFCHEPLEIKADKTGPYDEPTPFVRLVRNCKSLNEKQINAVNHVVCALIAKKWLDKQ